MKISFVIPAHNEEALIAQCIESIQGEIERVRKGGSTVETEIIVVNNASTDRTREVALRFAGVKVVDELKIGLPMARQAGLVASTGELVANVDADARLTQQWLTTVIRAFAHDPKLVCLSGPFIYYDLSWFARFLVRIFYMLGFLLYALNRFVLRVGSMVQGGNFVVRRDAMLKVGGFDTSIAFYGEDTDVARRLSPVGRVKWTFALPIYTSGRRLKGEGILLSSARYTANYFWITFFGRPFTSGYKPIRSK